MSTEWIVLAPLLIGVTVVLLCFVGCTFTVPGLAPLPFTPILIAGLYAWYDSTVGVTDAGGGAVSAWADQSGNGRNLWQGTAANRPKTGTRTQNGLNALEFTGGQKWLASGTMTQAQPFTVFVVHKSDEAPAPSTDDWLFTLGGTGGATGGPNFALSTVASAGGQYYVATPTTVTLGKGDTSPHTFSGVYNGASSQFWMDGTSQTTGNPGTTGMSSDVISLGIFNAGSAGAGFAWTGWIAEFIIYAASLSTADRQRVESYLRQKWGTP